MTPPIPKERREELRRRCEPDHWSESGPRFVRKYALKDDEFLSLLDAADELEKVREAIPGWDETVDVPGEFKALRSVSMTVRDMEAELKRARATVTDLRNALDRALKKEGP